MNDTPESLSPHPLSGLGGMLHESLQRYVDIQQLDPRQIEGLLTGISDVELRILVVKFCHRAAISIIADALQVSRREANLAIEAAAKKLLHNVIDSISIDGHTTLSALAEYLCTDIPVAERQIMILKLFRDLSLREIAHGLQMYPEEAKTKLLNGLRKLVRNCVMTISINAHRETSDLQDEKS